MPPRRIHKSQALPHSPPDVSFPALKELPVELLDLILTLIDRDDDVTLRACMLVSHTWHNFTRPHRFHTLHVCRNDTFRDLAARLIAEPDIGRMVRRLKLEGVPRYPVRRTRNSAYNGSRPNFAVLSLRMLVSILPLLPRLQELSLFRVALLPLCDITDPPARRHLRSLTVMDCREDHNPVNPHLLKSCFLFTLLSFVSADTVALSPTVLCHSTSCAHPRDPFVQPVRIKDLSLDLKWIHHPWFYQNNATEGPGELHAALQRSLALNALESFTITWPSATMDECLPTLGAVINDASSSLIHFDPGFVLGPVIRLNEDNPGEFTPLTVATTAFAPPSAPCTRTDPVWCRRSLA